MSIRPIRLIKKELDGKVIELNAAERKICKAKSGSFELNTALSKRSAIFREVEVLKVELFGEWASKSMRKNNSTDEGG